jgi:hypothetical protein
MSDRNGRPPIAADCRHNGRLTPRQESAALALAGGSTEAEAAALANCSARTLRVWLASSPNFGRRIGQLRSEMTAQALGRLVASMTRAADTLDELASSASAETVRLGAARAVLELAIKIRESTELEERIRALEARHGNTNGRTR